MANSYIDITLHITFHVKTTDCTVCRDTLPRLFQYIGGIVRELKGKPIMVGGEPDHIHLLVSIPSTVTVADFVMNVKKNSSKWLKTVDSAYRAFAWQDGYGAFSVSHSVIPKTIKYIANQEEHHKRVSMRDEYRSFLEANGIEYDERYI
jgi:REP element-mobilizing transposase RayT